VGADGAELELAPVLVVDGDTVLATPAQLAGTVVRAKVVGEARGPKIDAFVYKSKSNNRRRFGHRQKLSVLEITEIGAAKRKRTRAKPSTPETPASDAPADDAPADVAPDADPGES